MSINQCCPNIQLYISPWHINQHGNAHRKSRLTIDIGDPPHNLPGNQTAHKPAAHYRAVHHPIARWWTAGLIAGQLSIILKSREPMLSHKFLHLFGPFIVKAIIMLMFYH